MLFDKNTFIVPVAPADTRVYIKNTDNAVIFVIDPLSIVSLFTVGNEIRIKTKSDLHILPFDTSVNAILALPMLRAALDSIAAQNAPLTGGGTINYVAKFTPNGTTISNSILYDTGTRLGIGTIVPSALLHIKSTSGITFRTETSTGSLLDINDNNTITYTGFNVSFTGGNTLSDNLFITGSTGSGYISLINQSTNVSLSGTDTKIFSDLNGNISFFSNGFVKTIDGSSNTALRTYYLQNKTGTIAHLDDIFGIIGTSELAPVISVLNNPPLSPVIGDRYLVDTAPTGTWLTFENQIAEWNGTAWVFTAPILNNVLYITSVLMTIRYNGTSWVLYQGTAVLQNGNTLGGSLNIGTNDANSLTFKTDNAQRLTIISTGNIGIGTLVPTAALHLAGTFRYVDGNQAVGYILTSDLNGNAIWHAPALLNLQQVLTNGNSTGNIDIVSPNGTSILQIQDAYVYSEAGSTNKGFIDLEDSKAYIGTNDSQIGTFEGTLVSSVRYIQLSTAQNKIHHPTKNILDSLINEVSQDATTPLGIVTLQQLKSNIAAAPKKYTETASVFTANVIKTITHNIGNTAITVTLWDTTTGEIVLGFDAKNRTANSVDITLSVTGNYDIIIIG